MTPTMYPWRATSRHPKPSRLPVTWSSPVSNSPAAILSLYCTSGAQRSNKGNKTQGLYCFSAGRFGAPLFLSLTTIMECLDAAPTSAQTQGRHPALGHCPKSIVHRGPAPTPDLPCATHVQYVVPPQLALALSGLCVHVLARAARPASTLGPSTGTTPRMAHLFTICADWSSARGQCPAFIALHRIGLEHHDAAVLPIEGTAHRFFLDSRAQDAPPLPNALVP